jgi:isoleucyl-tRNA synthetase
VSAPAFQAVGPLDIPALQAEVLDYWEAVDAFARSVDRPCQREVVFYDGPPFPTGSPHHGTILVSVIKDFIARYLTMRGARVPRVWGWDCHGLPIETQAEKAIGIEDKKRIEAEVGVARFNAACREIVNNCNDAWRTYIRQVARWVDYANAYRTMDVSYMAARPACPSRTRASPTPRGPGRTPRSWCASPRTWPGTGSRRTSWRGRPPRGRCPAICRWR